MSKLNPASAGLVSICLTPLVIFLSGHLLLAQEPAAQPVDPQREQHFETTIRPLLAKHCFSCHGPEKQQGELRLDSAEALKRGNSSSPVVIPGDPAGSRLWQVLQYSPDDTQMPPDGKLSEQDLKQIEQWIRTGAYWPAGAAPASTPMPTPLPRKEDGSFDFVLASSQHWAWQPIQSPEVPKLEGPYSLTAIDQFIGTKLSEKGLTMSPEADRASLARRLWFDLLGLPPTAEELQNFVQDQQSEALPRLIDKLLSSKHYGERWGRHWLDLARYADTKGYVFTENRFYPYSYTYRDYVVKSLNDDKPYDRFLVEQLAADHLGLPENDPALAALGFLTVGPRFLNREPDIIDDRIDLVTRGLMGLTVGCARCHDHKYDPIPAQDYYSLYGVFASSYEPELPPLIGEVDESAPGYATFKAELDKREKELVDYVQKIHAEQLEELKNRAGDCLQALMKSTKRVREGLEPSFEGEAPRDKLAERWGEFLISKVRQNDPHAKLFDALSKLPAEGFVEKSRESLQAAQGAEPPLSPRLLQELQAGDLTNAYDVARAYGRTLKHLLTAPETDVAELDQPLKGWLTGAGSVTDLQASRDSSPLFSRDHRDKARGLERKVDEWRVQSPDAPPRAMALLDKEQPVNPVVFQRGDPNRRGEEVPRRFPRILTRGSEVVFQKGSGRLELAEAIVSPENPLTARAIVNRVWAHHFGVGLVPGGDFGTRGIAPSHPELLDHLAWRLIHEWGWSLKSLHREILLSHVYRQSSIRQDEGELKRCSEVDPENSLLWKQNRRRLEFEPYRDSLLAASGLLDKTFGGRPVDFEKQDEAGCRTIYGLIDRNNLPGLYRTFDFPAPDSSNPGRPQTTVPQQALFALNSRFVERCSEAFAKRVSEEASAPDAQVTRLFEIAYSRQPSPQEFQLLSSALSGNTLTLQQLAQAMLMSNEFIFID